MEDYIYLIFLVVWILFAFYRRSQKKSSQAGKVVTRPEPDKGFEPVPTFGDILFDNREEPPRTSSSSTPAWMEEGNFMTEMEETSFEKEYSSMGISSIEEPDKGIDADQIQLTDLQKDEISDEKQEGIEDKGIFNLRQAVIYSEILNRPYV